MKYIIAYYDPKTHKSPPARGAWIEIVEKTFQPRERYVAPRTGGVD